MKKFTTLALATAMVAAMGCTAFADIAFDANDPAMSEGGGGVMLDLVAAGYKSAADVCGKEITLYISVDDSDGFGGGIMFNSKSGDWQQSEDYYWCDPNGDKKVVAVGADGKYSVTFTVPEGSFADSDFTGEEGQYAQIVVQQWWGNDATISSKAGDVSPVAYLAAVAAVAGLAMVATKKRRA